MTNLRPEDVAIAAWALGYALVLGISLIIVFRVGGIPWRQVLNREEWMLLAKLVAIVLLVFFLVAARIALDVPEQTFIYGRF